MLNSHKGSSPRLSSAARPSSCGSSVHGDPDSQHSPLILVQDGESAKEGSFKKLCSALEDLAETPRVRPRSGSTLTWCVRCGAIPTMVMLFTVARFAANCCCNDSHHAAEDLARKVLVLYRKR